MNNKILENAIGWDIFNWGRGIEFWGKKVNLKNKIVLELGCGCKNGGLSLWAAELGAKKIICSDYKMPSEATQKIHKSYNFNNIIEYEQISALEIGHKDAFDVIMFKSMLGGIVRNDISLANTVLEQCSVALKRGGGLLIAENLVASRLHMLCRRFFLKRTWHYFKFNELEKLVNKC